jgi:hypothetical protein
MSEATSDPVVSHRDRHALGAALREGDDRDRRFLHYRGAEALRTRPIAVTPSAAR